MTEPRVTFRTRWLEFDGPQTPRDEPEEPSDVAGAFGPGFGPQTAVRGRRPGWVGLAFAGFALLVAIAVVTGPFGGNGEVTGALVSGLALAWVTGRIGRRFAQADGNPLLQPIIVGGFCLKMVGAVLRYHIAANVYGTGDFFDSDKWGVRIAAGLHHGHLITPPGRLTGTNFIRVATGFVYAVTPGQLFTGFVVFAWVGYLGLLFFWRAYCIAVSPSKSVRYLTWIVLLPSLLFWPSALGKDAYMLLAMGITSYGAACLLSDRARRGVVALAIGILAMSMVRPHIALIVCGGLGLAVLVRRARFGRRVLSVVLVAIAAVIVINVASSFLGINVFNQASVQQQLTDTTKMTSDGGSQFTPVQVNSPVKLPLAAFTVLYRPMPIEAHSAQELATSVEGLGLVAITIWTTRRWLYALRASRDYPYFAYCLGALLVFIVAFSGFSNFGILARQRSVIQPLLLVFLSLPSNMEALLPRARPGQGRARRQADMGVSADSDAPAPV